MDDIENINLRIIWVRHGYSCANLLKDNGKGGVKSFLSNLVLGKGIGDNRGKLTPDAKLTDKTIVNICKYNNENNNSVNFRHILTNTDLFLCSELTRAVETAVILFRGITPTIYVAPYIAEKRSGLGDDDNMPSTLDELQTNIGSLTDQYKTEIVSLCGSTDGQLPLTSLEIINEFRGALGTPTLPSFDNFLKLLIPHVLKKYARKPIIQLAIVSHSNYIKEITGIENIENLDFVLQEIRVSYARKIFLRSDKREDFKFELFENSGKLFIPINIGANLNHSELDVNSCKEINIYNQDGTACIWNRTSYGKIMSEEESVKRDDIKRCGEPVIEKILQGGGKIYKFKNLNMEQNK